jgi:JmjC domain, hydroxylase
MLQVWYSVSPNDRAKFENMAQQLYPELARNCKAFLRHKDILISPRVLKAFNVPFQQARQEVGEFIVLSAAAYHSGFNQVRGLCLAVGACPSAPACSSWQAGCKSALQQR